MPCSLVISFVLKYTNSLTVVTTTFFEPETPCKAVATLYRTRRCRILPRGIERMRG